ELRMSSTCNSSYGSVATSFAEIVVVAHGQPQHEDRVGQISRAPTHEIEPGHDDPERPDREGQPQHRTAFEAAEGVGAPLLVGDGEEASARTDLEHGAQGLGPHVPADHRSET